MQPAAMKYNNITRQIMEEFGARTGLLEAGSGPSCRYLWTDAFVVCNYLAFYCNLGSGLVYVVKAFGTD